MEKNTVFFYHFVCERRTSVFLYGSEQFLLRDEEGMLLAGGPEIWNNKNTSSYKGKGKMRWGEKRKGKTTVEEQGKGKNGP